MHCMRGRRHIRTILRWTLTVVMVVLVMVWVGSGWYYLRGPLSSTVGKSKYTHFVIWDRGVCTIAISGGDGSPLIDLNHGWVLNKTVSVELPLWKWEFERIGAGVWVQFPLWLFVLLFAIPTTMLWVSHIRARRRGPYACVKCGYDTRGLAGTQTCPECGTVFEVAKSQVSAS